MPSTYNLTVKGSHVHADYALVVDGQGFTLTRTENKGDRYARFAVFPPYTLSATSADDALEQAITAEEEVTSITARASGGGFFDRFGRMSTETWVACRVLDTRAGILEVLAGLMANRTPFGFTSLPNREALTSRSGGVRVSFGGTLWK